MKRWILFSLIVWLVACGPAEALPTVHENDDVHGEEETLPPKNEVPPSPTGSRIAVANRGEGTISLIDVADESVVEIVLEDGSEPMYAQNPYYSDEIWVGDRGHSRVLVYDALRLRRIAEIEVCDGVFHMWNHGTSRQMWVVCDVDKAMAVISLDSKELLATVPIPEDLVDSYKPHDMTVTAEGAIVSLLGDDSAGWLIQYDGTTFEEVNRLEVGADPHLMYWGFADSQLYVASQGAGKVYEVDPNTLTIHRELDVSGAHGIWGNEQENFLYVGDITSNGADAIYTIDIETFEITAVSDAVLPASHNLMVSIDNSKLFVTHSGGAGLFTSIYDLDNEGVPHNGRFVETGATPFGIMLIRDPQS